MNRILLLVMTILFIGNVLSQPYQSIFGSNSTTWSLVIEGYCDYVCSSYYTPESDTTVESLTYAILPNYGFIREDTELGKVWFYDEYWNQEFLVMDIGLNVNDEFTIYDLSGIPNVFLVDSLTFSMGKKHVYLNCDINICGMIEPLVFIEGSGTNAGFNYQHTFVGNNISSYMLCHSKDDLHVQGNTLFFDDCEMCEMGIEGLHTNSKELIGVFDYLGREVRLKQNTPLIFYYSDGSVERKWIME